MKKLLLSLGIALSLVIPAGIVKNSTIVYADEIQTVEGEGETKTPVVPEEEKKGVVIIEATNYGDVLTDITEGKVGDIVTVMAKPYLMCDTKGVYVNGTELIKLDNGNYQFTLIEGENRVTAKFDVNNEKVKDILSLIESTKGKDLTDLFTFDNLLILITWLVVTVLSSGFFITLIKSKKIKVNVTDEVKQTVESTLDSNLGEKMEPIIQKMLGKLGESNEMCKTLIKVFILSQENTPESRLAIINELTKLNVTEEDLSNKVKEIINQEVEKNKQTEEKKKQTIAELEKVNEQILDNKESNIEVNTDTTKDDSEGRY